MHTLPDLHTLAIHEAGHAAWMAEFGGTVYSIDISSRLQSNDLADFADTGFAVTSVTPPNMRCKSCDEGYVIVATIAESNNYDINFEETCEGCLEMLAACLSHDFAGGCATALLASWDHQPEQLDGDKEDIKEFLQLAGLSPACRRKVLKRAVEIAKVFVKQNSTFIRKIANAALKAEGGILKGEALDAILCSARH
jgi:hypothetical protein